MIEKEVCLVEGSLSYLDKSAKYAVGWSGGIDSTALIVAMKNRGFDVSAWHIDHAWRDFSEKERKFFEEFSQKHDIPLYSERLEHAKSSKNKEAIARSARYAQFDAWSFETSVENICLGHHKEDQAETVYMRLLKGSGIRGCVGIRKENKMGDIIVHRPFLELNKKTLKSYLEDNNVSWIEDPSNDDTTILRNKIRNITFPSMKKCGMDPIDIFVRIGKMSALAEIGANELIDKYSYEIVGEGAVKFKWEEWNSMSGEIKKLFLQKMGKELFDQSFSFGKRHLEYANDWTGKGSIDLSKSKLERKKGNMILSRAM